ncbi:MAG: cupin domain-containing protein [Anaerolineae bacterium]
MKVIEANNVEAQPAPGIEGVTLRWVLAKNVAAPNFHMRVIEVQPGAATEKHQHAWEHEVYVLEGTGSVLGQEGTLPISRASCVFIAPNELHQFSNTGQTPLRFICVIPKL